MEERVHYLSDDFCVHEDSFQHFQPHSFIVLDDFSFKKANNKQEKADFMKVVNFNLRHQNITLVLIVHNMYNNNLTSEIMLAPHLFLAYSNLGYEIMRYIYLGISVCCLNAFFLHHFLNFQKTSWSIWWVK